MPGHGDARRIKNVLSPLGVSIFGLQSQRKCRWLKSFVVLADGCYYHIPARSKTNVDRCGPDVDPMWTRVHMRLLILVDQMWTDVDRCGPDDELESTRVYSSWWPKVDSHPVWPI